jgi:hypothetical protein
MTQISHLHRRMIDDLLSSPTQNIPSKPSRAAQADFRGLGLCFRRRHRGMKQSYDRPSRSVISISCRYQRGKIESRISS